MSELHVHTSNDLSANPLTRKLGPLPVFAWAGIICGMAFAYSYWKKRTGAAAAPVDPTGAASSASDLSTPDLANSAATDSLGAPVQPLPAPSPDPSLPKTNSGWAIMVSQRLSAAGHDPAQISRAISEYLGGATPSASDYALIQAALRISPPPEGIIAAKAPLAPVKAKPKSPVKVTKPTKGPTAPVTLAYTVRKGDSWQSISKIHYGSDAEWRNLQIFNGGHGPVLIPGHKIYIPRV